MCRVATQYTEHSFVRKGQQGQNHLREQVIFVGLKRAEMESRRTQVGIMEQSLQETVESFMSTEDSKAFPCSIYCQKSLSGSKDRAAALDDPKDVLSDSTSPSRACAFQPRSGKSPGPDSCLGSIFYLAAFP